MIPKILHQTAKTAVVPEKWRPLQDKVRDLHPGWEYHLWTDDDNLALLEARRPDLVPAYLSMPRPIMRADMIRYFYMEQFGGLYLDTDYEFLKPFDLGDRTLVLPRESEHDQPLYLGNCVFASVPGHAYWTAVLADLRDDPPAGRSDLDEDAVLRLTGPGFLTRIYQDRFASDSSIYVTPKLMFHPPVPQDDQALGQILATRATYGIHWCFGSWRALTPWARLKNRVRKVFRF